MVIWSMRFDPLHTYVKAQGSCQEARWQRCWTRMYATLTANSSAQLRFHCSSDVFYANTCKELVEWTCQHYSLALQVSGLVPADTEAEQNGLKGLLLIGHMFLDPKGKEMPSWPLPAFGVGNGAHLALADLRCPADAPDDKAN